MYYNPNYIFPISLSDESFADKRIAKAMIGSSKIPENREIRKQYGYKSNRGVSFREQIVDLDSFCTDITTGKVFCHIFKTDLRRKDGSFGDYQKCNNNFIGTHIIPIDVDKTQYNTAEEYIERLSLKPTFWHTTYSNKQEDNQAKFRLIYVFNQFIPNIFLYKFCVYQLKNIINRDTQDSIAIDDCIKSCAQYFNGTNKNSPGIVFKSGRTDIIYSLEDINVTETAFIRFLCNWAGYKSSNVDMKPYIISTLNSFIPEDMIYVCKNGCIYKEPYQFDSYKENIKLCTKFVFPEPYSTNLKSSGGLLNLCEAEETYELCGHIFKKSKDSGNKLSNKILSICKENYYCRKLNYEAGQRHMETNIFLRDFELDSRYLLKYNKSLADSVENQNSLGESVNYVEPTDNCSVVPEVLSEFKITETIETLSGISESEETQFKILIVEPESFEFLNDLNELSNLNNSNVDSPIPKAHHLHQLSDVCEKGEVSLFSVNAMSPDNLIDFDLILNCWDKLPLEEFKKVSMWIDALNTYKYIYRKENNEWINGKFQFVDDDYLSLFYIRETVRDRQHRRKELYKRMCMRKYMYPNITYKQLIFNTILDIILKFDNSDKVLDSEFITNNVKSVMESSISEIEEKFKGTIEYLKKETTPKKNIIYVNGKAHTEETTFEIFDMYYDSNKSMSENLEYITNTLGYSKMTFYRYAKSRGYKDSCKLTDEEIYELVNTKLSINKNREMIVEKGKKVKFKRVAEALKQKIEDEKNVVNEPITEYGFNSTTYIEYDDILDMPLGIAMEKYGLEFRSDGIYIDDELIAEWEYCDEDESDDYKDIINYDVGLL